MKWRLNVGRSRIKERIEANQMDKVYQRINWNTYGCNDTLDTNRYLHSQVARAICQAAYEKPLTVEEISLCTGIPALYIEDALPELEYGDAIRRSGNKYATDFIIFRLKDRAATEAVSLLYLIFPLLSMIRSRRESFSFRGQIFSVNRLEYQM